MAKSKNNRLFLDDFRRPLDAFHLVPADQRALYNLDGEPTWDIVVNYDRFKEWILTNGLPEIVSFDHDLADEHYTMSFEDWNEGSSEQLGVERTGLDCAKFLVEYCVEHNLKLPLFNVHSQNPVGRRNIQEYLNNAVKHLSL